MEAEGAGDNDTFAQIDASDVSAEEEIRRIEEALGRRARAVLTISPHELSGRFWSLAESHLPVETDAAVKRLDEWAASRRRGNFYASTSITKPLASYFKAKMEEHFAEVAQRGSRSPAVRARLIALDSEAAAGHLDLVDTSHLLQESHPGVTDDIADTASALVRVDLDLTGFGYPLPRDKSSATIALSDDLKTHSQPYFQDDPGLQDEELQGEKESIVKYAEIAMRAQTAVPQAVQSMPDTDFADPESQDLGEVLTSPFAQDEEVRRKREQLVVNGLEAIDQDISEIAKATKYDKDLQANILASNVSNWTMQFERVEANLYSLTSTGFDAWSDEFEELLVSV